MQQQKKQLILQALKNSLAKNKDQKLFQYSQSQPKNQQRFRQHQYKQNKPLKRNLYAQQLMSEQKEQKDTGLQKGVELMIDNTVLLMENLSKLVALNVQDSWTVRR